jgi:hypothetical protein
MMPELMPGKVRSLINVVPSKSAGNGDERAEDLAAGLTISMATSSRETCEG